MLRSCTRLNNDLQIGTLDGLCIIPCCLYCGGGANTYSGALNIRRMIAKNPKKYCNPDCWYEWGVEEFQEIPHFKHISLAISTKCNGNCYYCFVHPISVRTSFWPRFKKVIEDKFIAKAEWIRWVMGEFYFDKELADEFVSYKDKYGCAIHVDTNGIVYDPEIPVDKLMVSLHGFDKESYIRNCGVDVFDKVIRNIDKIPVEKYTGFSLVLNNECIERPDDVISFIQQHIPNNIPLRFAVCVNDVRKKREGSERETAQIIADAVAETHTLTREDIG